MSKTFDPQDSMYISSTSSLENEQDSAPCLN